MICERAREEKDGKRPRYRNARLGCSEISLVLGFIQFASSESRLCRSRYSRRRSNQNFDGLKLKSRYNSIHSLLFRCFVIFDALN